MCETFCEVFTEVCLSWKADDRAAAPFQEEVDLLTCHCSHGNCPGQSFLLLLFLNGSEIEHTLSFT